MVIVAGQFPSETEFARIKQETLFNRLYECEVYNENTKKGVFKLKEQFSSDKDKEDILAIALNTPQLIVDAGVDFLFGKPVRIVYTGEVQKEGEGSGNSTNAVQDRIDNIVKRNKLNTKLRESAASFQSIGHTQFIVRRDIEGEGDKQKNVIVIDEVAFDNWYPDYSGVPLGGAPRSVRIASHLRRQQPGQAVENFIYVMEHFAGSIEHSLWSEQDGKAQQQIPLETLPGLAESVGVPVPEEGKEGVTMTHTEQTDVNELLVEQIDTPKTIKKRFGKSLMVPIFPLLEEINDRLTQMSLQFWKNFDPLLEVPESAVVTDKNNKVKRRSLDVIIKDQDMPDSRYVTNDNPLVESMMKYLDKMIEKCAELTKTPRSFLQPDDKGGVETAESLKTRFMLFLKRINTYQDKYDDAIKRMIRLALELEDGTKIDEDDIEIFFDPGLPKDMQVETTWITQAYQAGLISRKRALMMLHGLEGDQLDDEVKEIEREEQMKMQSVFPMDTAANNGNGDGTQ